MSFSPLRSSQVYTMYFALIYFLCPSPTPPWFPSTLPSFIFFFLNRTPWVQCFSAHVHMCLGPSAEENVTLLVLASANGVSLQGKASWAPAPSVLECWRTWSHAELYRQLRLLWAKERTNPVTSKRHCCTQSSQDPGSYSLSASLTFPEWGRKGCDNRCPVSG